jgi:nucleolar protein 56
MKAYVAIYFTGVFAFDGKGKLITATFFPKEPAAIAERLGASRKNEMLQEEIEVKERLRAKGFSEIITGSGPENTANARIRQNFRKIALDRKWATSEQEINAIVGRVNILLSSTQMKVVKKDKMIIQVIRIIDEMDTDLNNLAERFREWYGLHFPELSRSIKTHEKFLELVSEFGSKDNFKADFAKMAERSSGMKFSEDDIRNAQNLSSSLLSMYRTREALSAYLEKLCVETAPNVSAVAGPLLAARILSLAGGVENMAKMPSSKIQLLGAEKALFRHLRGQGKAPKYGILFSHPLIQQAPREMKGKIARLIAAKLCLAAKIDQYSKRDMSVEMKREIETKIANLMKNAPSGGQGN